MFWDLLIAKFSFVLSLWLCIFNLLCNGPGVVSNIAPRGIVSVIVSVCMAVTYIESV